ncbi:MAG: glutamate--cysteine ligase [Gammaproteobacteria bacterium]|nr:MAG: glutamate--cysteine ligase [Gammaproteobacteria bacterium]RLA20631.1 MAG: glutamate--cysteine ligase [Gammaproteobacteria bacterium]
MGLEIDNCTFSNRDFEQFRKELARETEWLQQAISSGNCSEKSPTAGFEIEAWLVDEQMKPAPLNSSFLKTLNDPLATPELAKFNIELNNSPLPLKGNVLQQLNRELESTWGNVIQTAESMGLSAVMIGILPTLEKSSLCLRNMSELNRFRALNEQILKQRNAPIHLDINGKEHLKLDHHDVMLESAATSFQVHMQVPLNRAHHFYNASIIASAPCVAISANSPFLFKHDLWDETRIPLFEQSIETGGYGGAARGPIRRVSFGTDYARKSIMECFEENLQHFPVLLPVHYASDIGELAHLRLHNGTIWRWNRPLIGFDQDSLPHIRIEHRIMAAGPTIIDSVANAAFFYGLTTAIEQQLANEVPRLTFAQAKDNFYLASKNGLDAHLSWDDGEHQRIQTLLLEKLLPLAREGLAILGINHSDAKNYLDIICERVESKQNGCQWQRHFIKQQNSNGFKEMVEAYLSHQKTEKPVHTWSLSKL